MFSGVASVGVCCGWWWLGIGCTCVCESAIVCIAFPPSSPAGTFDAALTLCFVGFVLLLIAVPVALVMAALNPRRSSTFLEELGRAGMQVVGPARPSLGGVWKLVYVLDVRCCRFGVVRRMSFVVDWSSSGGGWCCPGYV